MDYQNDPWADALAQQENERRSQRDAQMQRDQTAINDEMTEVVRRNAMENAKRQMSFNNLLASAVKYSNGGELPEVVRNFMNRKMGFDGVNTGVLGGGYQQDGSYAFDFANGVDQQGAVVRQRRSFGPTSLYNMMSQNRVAFNDADRSSMRKNLLHLGYSEKEVSDMDSALASSYGGSNQASSASAQSGKVADPDHISNHLGADGRSLGSGAVMKTYDRRPHDVEMYSNFREPGMTAGGYVSGRKADGTRYGYNLGRQKSEAELWHQFSVGPSDDGKTQVRGYKNELTKEVVYVKDGENPPWRQSQGNNGKLSVDDRLAIEREKNKGKIDVENARGQNRIDVASANNKSRESIADKNNAAKLKIADIGAELKRLGFEVDEKKLAEAIRHNKANEATANNRVAETTRHNQVAEGQGQSRLDETSRHNKANEAHQSAELDEKKRHNQETEGLRKQWNDIYDRVRTQANILKSNGNLMTDDERKRVIEEMKSMQKILWGGGLEGENRTAIRDRLNVLSRQLTGKTADKGADDGDTNGNKSITGYVYTADRKWRKPRYEDGTVGKAELTPVK